MKAFYRLLYYLSILLTSILAGFTLAGAFAGDASPDSFTLMPFIGLILPVLLLANVVSAIYWTVRWRCWVFIPFIAILGNWGYPTRVLQSPLFDSASQPNTESLSLKKNERGTESALTIATYNVNSFNHEHTGFSCKGIAAYMKELGVDIFCFQEFGINHEFGIDSLRTVLSEWPYYYVPSSPAGESLLQLAVFSRYPIKEKQLVTYPNSNNCSLWCGYRHQRPNNPSVQQSSADYRSQPQQAQTGKRTSCGRYRPCGTCRSHPCRWSARELQKTCCTS